MSENRLVTLKAHSDVYATFEGDDAVLAQIVVGTRPPTAGK